MIRIKKAQIIDSVYTLLYNNEYERYETSGNSTLLGTSFFVVINREESKWRNYVTI